MLKIPAFGNTRNVSGNGKRHEKIPTAFKIIGIILATILAQALDIIAKQLVDKWTKKSEGNETFTEKEFISVKVGSLNLFISTPYKILTKVYT